MKAENAHTTITIEEDKWTVLEKRFVGEIFDLSKPIPETDTELLYSQGEESLEVPLPLQLGPDPTFYCFGWEPEDYWKVVVERRLLITCNDNMKTEDIISDSEYDECDPNYEQTYRIKRER